MDERLQKGFESLADLYAMAWENAGNEEQEQEARRLHREVLALLIEVAQLKGAQQ